MAANQLPSTLASCRLPIPHRGKYNTLVRDYEFIQSFVIFSENIIINNFQKSVLAALV